jgi:hypothetical protein
MANSYAQSRFVGFHLWELGYHVLTFGVPKMMKGALVALVGIGCPLGSATIFFPLRSLKHPLYFFVGIALAVLVNMGLSLVDRLRRKRGD